MWQLLDFFHSQLPTFESNGLDDCFGPNASLAYSDLPVLVDFHGGGSIANAGGRVCKSEVTVEQGTITNDSPASRVPGVFQHELLDCPLLPVVALFLFLVVLVTCGLDLAILNNTKLRLPSQCMVERSLEALTRDDTMLYRNWVEKRGQLE